MWCVTLEFLAGGGNFDYICSGRLATVSFFLQLETMGTRSPQELQSKYAWLLSFQRLNLTAVCIGDIARAVQILELFTGRRPKCYSTLDFLLIPVSQIPVNEMCSF